MKIIFFGTDLFAKEILSFLLERELSIVAVVTQPDKPKGRDQNLSPPPVKEFLQEKGWDGAIFQPERASRPEFVEVLQRLEPDLFVVVSYGQLLKQNLLDVPRLGAINVHPSLLPKYRGPSPIQSAVLAGEKEVGTTIMEMVLAMDAGDILRVQKLSLGEETTFGEIEKELCNLSKKLLLETIGDLKSGTVKKEPQKESEALYTKKITSLDSVIDWQRSKEELCNFVRGMNPRPGARCFVEVQGKKLLLKIFRIKKSEEKGGRPGEVLFFDAKRGFHVACRDGAIAIEELQIEGKKKMTTLDFIKGINSITIL